MGINPEGMIKKAISETITEELFRDLGFYFLKLGQENTINPLVQLEHFIASCDGKFKLKKKDAKYIYSIDYVRDLNDFLIGDKNGDVNLIEIKYRYNAMLYPLDGEVFNTYPETILLVVNSSVSEDILNVNSSEKEKQDDLKNSRFHIHELDKSDTSEDAYTIHINPLKEWLKNKFGIDKNSVLKSYEDLDAKWIIDERCQVNIPYSFLSPSSFIYMFIYF